MSERRMTATQAKRAAYPYREMYFKKNPGIFGCIWICSQCYKPIFGKQNVVIDHIIPLAKGGRNHVSNCTACCRTCNSRKSDKVDYRVVKGKIFKMVESNAYRAQRGVGAVAMLGLASAASVARLPVAGVTTVAGSAGGLAVNGIKGVIRFTLFKAIPSVIKGVLFPVTHGSVVSRLFFVGLYAMIVLFFLRDNTSLLNAWTI